MLLYLAAWLFLDETLKKLPVNITDDYETDSIATDSIATECESDSMITTETDLIGDSIVTDDSMVTANGKLIEDSESEVTSVDDMEAFLESHDPPVVKTNWSTRVWELFYDRVYCCHGCDLRKINYKLSRKDFISAHDKIVTMAKLMMDRRVVVSVSLYGLLGLAVIITNEVIMVLLLYYQIT